MATQRRAEPITPGENRPVGSSQAGPQDAEQREVRAETRWVIGLMVLPPRKIETQFITI